MTAHPLPNIRLEDGSVREILQWILDGTPPPAPGSIKAMTVMSYVRKYGYRNFIETGTYTGYTTEAVANMKVDVTTIELSERIYNLTRQRLSGHANIRFLLGDSGVVLPQVLDETREPSVIWLDGHYSEGGTAKGQTETPILEELKAIFKHRDKRHVVLIDDIRCFGKGDYPVLEEVLNLIARMMPGYSFEVFNDICRIEPPLVSAA